MTIIVCQLFIKNSNFILGPYFLSSFLTKDIILNVDTNVFMHGLLLKVKPNSLIKQRQRCTSKMPKYQNPIEKRKKHRIDHGNIEVIV